MVQQAPGPREPQQQAAEVGEGAGLLWPLLAASHASPPDEQCQHLTDAELPRLLIAGALPFRATHIK